MAVQVRAEAAQLDTDTRRSVDLAESRSHSLSLLQQRGSHICDGQTHGFKERLVGQKPWLRDADCPVSTYVFTHPAPLPGNSVASFGNIPKHMFVDRPIGSAARQTFGIQGLYEGVRAHPRTF